MKIKISKSQWEGIGKKAGWMEEAGNTPASLASHLSQIEQALKNMNGQDFTDIIASYVGPSITKQIIDRIKQEGINPKRQIAELPNVNTRLD